LSYERDGPVDIWTLIVQISIVASALCIRREVREGLFFHSEGEKQMAKKRKAKSSKKKSKKK
jgi:hypothetical protein